MLYGFSGSGEAVDEKLDVGDEEPSLCAGNGPLEVFGETTVASEPRKGAYNDPALRLRFEPAGLLGVRNDGDGPATELGYSIAQLGTAIDAVGKDVPQLGEALPQRAEQRHRAVTILDVGGVDQKRQQQALSIGDDVTLASFDALEHVKPARPATFCGLDALTIDDAGRRHSVASQRDAHPPHQGKIDPPPDALLAPEIEVVLDGGSRRKVAW